MIRIQINQFAVAGAGLEQQARAPVSARLGIDHDAHLGLKRRIVEEGGGAQKPIFLAVGQNRDHGVEMRRLRGGAQGPRGLDDGGHARSIVGGAGPGGHRIVMGHQHDRLAGARKDWRHEVGHGGAGEHGRAALAVAAQRGVRLGGDPEVLEFGDDARAHVRVGDGRGRMRHLRPQDAGEHGSGSERGELRGRCARRHGRRDSVAIFGQRPDAHRQRGQHQGLDRRCDAVHLAPPSPSGPPSRLRPGLSSIREAFATLKQPQRLPYRQWDRRRR